MSKKYEVVDPVDTFYGTVTKPKAKRAVSFGLAKHHKDVNKRIIITGCHNMEHFEREYKECMKNRKYRKVECWNCGKAIKVMELYKIPYCKECEADREKQNKRDRALYTELRTQFMFERAMNMLEKQNKVIDIDDYKEASKALKEYTLENSGKFDSSHEMLVAMELINNKVHIKIQPKVGDKNPDFIMTYERIVLEIDGYMHKHSQEADYRFDEEVRQKLGNEWEVIRIPTKYIEKNISKLYDAIMELKIYKQKLREENYGIIPEYFSKRESKVFSKII